MLKRIIILMSGFIFYFSIFSTYALAVAVNENQDITKNVLLKIEHDQRPTDLEYARMSKHAYDPDVKKGQIYQDLPDWKVHEVVSGKNDYKSVVFKNTDTRQLVIAHRGTNPTSVGNLVEDIQSIIRSKTSRQELEIYKLIKEVISYAEEEGYCHISFTGHSLGAFLAEMSVFFCYNDFDYPQANAVTFESPGSDEAIENGLQPQQKEHKLSTENMDIIGYVAIPNAINTFNHHIGSMYLVEPNLNDPGWGLNPVWYTKESHSIDNIVKYFNEYYSQKADFSYYISDWPIADWSAVGNLVGIESWTRKIGRLLYSFGTAQRNVYSKYIELEKNDQGAHYRLVLDKDNTEAVFDLSYNAHYPVKDVIQRQYDSRLSLPLKHFGIDMQIFLSQFYNMLCTSVKSDEDRQKLAEEWLAAEIPTEIANYLMGFQIAKTKSNKYVIILNSDAINMGAHNTITPIHKFRNDLSKYLQDYPEKINALLSLATDNLEIDVSVAEGGAEVIGEVKNPVVKGIDAMLVGITSEELVKIHREQQSKFIEKLKEIGVKIKASVVKSGGKVGSVTNPVVKGVDVSVYGNDYECDAQGNCKKKTGWF